MIGLVLGKLVGITLGTALAVRLRVGALPPGLPVNQVLGGAALSGIGFTISLFIVDLALDDPALQDEARVGVLAASVLAALLGWSVFRAAAPLGREPSGPPMRMSRPVDPERDHVRGPVDAPLTLVEYGDFECPFCSRATGSIRDVREHFGDRLRYVFRHLPLEDVHPHAALAAEASEAAAAQGKFWEMHDHLFAHQDELELHDLMRHAWALDLDMSPYVEGLVSGQLDQARAPRPGRCRGQRSTGHPDVLHRRRPARRPARRRHPDPGAGAVGPARRGDVKRTRHRKSGTATRRPAPGFAASAAGPERVPAVKPISMRERTATLRISAATPAHSATEVTPCRSTVL